MKERSFDEMVAYFNRRVSEMDIAQDYKMELLGMVTALGYKHEKTAQRWIPCSERLPEKRDWYLGIFEESDTGWINPLPFICEYLLGKKTKATTKEGWILKECTDREEHIDYYFNLKCVAWMPLPEPWRGDSICK